MKYTSSSKKKHEIFLKKIEVFRQKNEGVTLMTVTSLVQKVAYIYAVLLERERFLYRFSVLINMSYECEKNF